MHIPAVDALRQERVGLMTEDDVSMLVQAYVETGDTEERGAYDPVEGMARPFPLMMKAETPTVVESFFDGRALEPLSDGLLEYVSLLKESAEAGEWVDELEEFSEDQFSDVERVLASSLMVAVSGGAEMSRTLWRTMYENAGRDESEETVIRSNTLRDVEGRERYGFDYLPPLDEVGEWELVVSAFERESEEDELVVAGSLWLRYQIGDVQEERPLVAFENENAGFVVSSPNVEFGDGMESASVELVEAILSDEQEVVDVEGGWLGGADASALEGTRTKEYLEAFVGE